MARLLPKRGDEANRTSSNQIVQDEIHVSKNNGGPGAPTRFWVRGPAGADTLVGPFAFAGDDRIAVSTDTTTGVVTISYQDALTFNPSQQLFATASSYTGNNPVIEVRDFFDTQQTLRVTTGSGSNESRIDWATWEYNALTTNFGGNLASRNDVNLASGSQDYLWTPSAGDVGAPLNFTNDPVGTTNNLGTRRRSVVIRCYSELRHAAQFPNPDSTTPYFNWGWRVRGFYSTTLYTDVTLMSATSFTTGSVLNKVVQSPRTDLGGSSTAQAITWDLPSGGPYYLYFAHSCQADGNGSDDYGWTPNFTLLGSGSVGWTEVSDMTADGGYTSSPNVSNSNIGGQATEKYYRLWRSPNAYAGNQSWTFVVT